MPNYEKHLKTSREWKRRNRQHCLKYNKLELKNTLMPYYGSKEEDGHIESIRGKFSHSIGKLKVILSHFFEKELEQDILIKSFIIYNNDQLSSHAKADPTVKSLDFYKILSNPESKLLPIEDSLDELNHIEVFFIKNLDHNKEEYSLDISEYIENYKTACHCEDCLEIH
jgi:hypothetical protein